jgi:hypothetical protein
MDLRDHQEAGAPGRVMHGRHNSSAQADYSPAKSLKMLTFGSPRGILKNCRHMGIVHKPGARDKA